METMPVTPGPHEMHKKRPYVGHLWAKSYGEGGGGKLRITLGFSCFFPLAPPVQPQARCLQQRGHELVPECCVIM